MDEYASEWYLGAVRIGLGECRPSANCLLPIHCLILLHFGMTDPGDDWLADAIEACAADDPPSPGRLDEWKTVWERCTGFEKAFWDMAMELS